MFDLNSFIGKYVTKRPESMFLQDIENNKEITLEVGERVSGTYKLNQNVGYDADNEKIINIKIDRQIARKSK